MLAHPTLLRRRCSCCRTPDSETDRVRRCGADFLCAFCLDGGHLLGDEPCVADPGTTADIE